MQQAEDELQQEITIAWDNYESKVMVDLIANNNYSIYISDFTNPRSLSEILYLQSYSASEDLVFHLYQDFFWVPEFILNLIWWSQFSFRHNDIDEEDVYNLDPAKATECDGINQNYLKSVLTIYASPLFTKSLSIVVYLQHTVYSEIISLEDKVGS